VPTKRKWIIQLVCRFGHRLCSWVDHLTVIVCHDGFTDVLCGLYLYIPDDQREEDA
jgi:hypothetical protein